MNRTNSGLIRECLEEQNYHPQNVLNYQTGLIYHKAIWYYGYCH